MSLLSSTQGTPERVWSLMAALAASGGCLSRADALGWLNPGFDDQGKIVQENSDTFNQTLGAATSLGAAEVTNHHIQLSAGCTATSFPTFCDWVHDQLAPLPSTAKDAVVLETYAWLVVEADRQRGLNWVCDWPASSFADAADKALPEGADDDGGRRINTTKLPAWRRWLSCLGLLVPMPMRMPAFPDVTPRAMREIERSNLPIGQEMSAAEFLTFLAGRLPYLDGGRMFSETAKRIGHVVSPRQLSPVLSTAVRQFHDEGWIQVRVPGDATDVFDLFPDPTHTVKALHSVVLLSRDSA